MLKQTTLVETTPKTCPRCRASGDQLQRVHRTAWQKWFFSKRYECSGCGETILCKKAK